MSFSFSKTLQYAVDCTFSVRYLDLALGKYEKCQTEAKVILVAANRFKYIYADQFIDPFRYDKIKLIEILQAVSDFFDSLTIHFFNEFEQKIYRAIIDEDQEELHIMRYLVACRKTNILKLDYVNAVTRQRVLFNILLILKKTKCCNANLRLFIEFFQTFCNEFNLGFRIYTQREYMPHLDFILEQCKQAKYMLWGGWPTYKLEGEPFNPICIYLFTSHTKHLELMFKFGIDYAFSMPVYQITCGIFSNIKNGDILFCKDDTHNNLLQYKEPQRLHLILINFCIFCSARENITDNFMNLLLMWRTISDALVTAAEMETALKPLVKKDFNCQFNKTIRIYRNSTIFDNQQAQYTPRPLAHLCRVAVRRTLSRNFNLPEGINEFDIPETLKDFLSLKC